MMGDNLNAKTPFNPFKLTAPPPQIREDSLADRRKKSTASTASKVSAARILREKSTKLSKSPPTQWKTIGNPSSSPKNGIYYEDTAPLRTLFDPFISSFFSREQVESGNTNEVNFSDEYKEHGYTGEDLQKKEKQLLEPRGKFTRETLLLYYCLNLLCLVRNPKTIPMNRTHIFPHESFASPAKNWPLTQIQKHIRKNEDEDRGYYVSNSLTLPSLSPRPNFNKSANKVHNMHAYFLDTDGFGFDKIFTPKKRFEFRKISSTISQLAEFFLSAEIWLEGTEKFLGLVHPNAEKIEIIGFNEEANQATMRTHTKLSSLGYGYYLPQAYRSTYLFGGKKINAPQTFTQMFEDEIHSRLQNSINSNCDDLMENYNDSPYFQKASYCENQLIAAYISKSTNAKRQKNPNWRALEDICTKLEPNMIKDVFTKTNFVTLYRVKKVDSTHVTIEKETFDEIANKSLEKKLDEMISRLEDEEE